MTELLEVLKTLSIQELHLSPYEYRVDFLAPWEHSGALGAQRQPDCYFGGRDVAGADTGDSARGRRGGQCLRKAS